MSIHETVPYQEKPSDKLKQKVRALISKRVGRDYAITTEAICKRLGIESKGTNGAIRLIMKELLNDELLPVLSCTDGFFMADQLSEIDTYEENMLSRIQGIRRDLVALRKVREAFL